MPKSLFLQLTHKPQEEDAGCLAACAQMLLNHIDINVTQAQLNQLFGLTMGGVSLSRLTRLKPALGVDVVLGQGDEQTIQSFITQNQPVIVFVRTDQLSYWTIDTRHAMVVVGYDEQHIWLNDPAFTDAPKNVLVDELMLAWLEFDFQYAIIKNNSVNVSV